MEKDKWKVGKNAWGSHSIITENTYIGTIDRHFNANLIVEAVNACIELNPDNPLAVAKSIKGFCEACKITLKHLNSQANNKNNPIIRILEQALAKAEGK